MTDYGHDILLGAFILPETSRAAEVVALAQTADRAGFDLVSFSDHPYRSADLDCWTLFAWVLATTERVHIAGDVLNLPMRPPAMLARAAASLDLLSGGRVNLGIGAGWVWDSIEAMGGERRTPREAVDALEEAVDVIRALWNANDKEAAAVNGRYYRVNGAGLCPAPAHDIPIWLASTRPRSLGLVGRKADGWLTPALPNMQPGDIERGNQSIDESALGAGRDPRSIRRLTSVIGEFTSSNGGFLKGPPRQWVEELLPLAVNDGISGFIALMHDHVTIERFASEVAPGLREAVARERGTAVTSGQR
jgi:alkanesulfonate monooxygenase SsuD/methylene tetrahydromethanopterin reductase-like flavin-dependent oxidoreductase (luciferase family)